MEIKLSNTSKMPCKSWGIPATTCKTGKKLNKIKGSVCSGCYALKGAYSWPKVKDAYQVRLDQYKSNPKFWETQITTAINKEGKRQLKTTDQVYFRWFDSGDLQSVKMLEHIVSVACNLNYIKFWLPTREFKIIKDYIKKHGANSIPSNLTIRLSDMMVDQKTVPSDKILGYGGLFQSGVVSEESKANCHSFKQHGKCLACRACWDSKAKINYLKH